jgi:hypothetical protein
MKIFIKFMTLIFCASSLSAQSQTWFPFGKEGANTGYTKRGRCQQVEGQKCYDITGRDLRRFRIGNPLPKVPQTVDCADADACQAIIDERPDRCGDGTPRFDDKANWPSLDFAGATDFEGNPAPRPAEGFFLWCERETLVLDSAKASEADAEDAAREAARSTRRTRRQGRDVDLKQCVRVALRAPDLPPGAAQTNQLAQRQNRIKDCLGAIIKEVIEQRLELEDL